MSDVSLFGKVCIFTDNPRRYMQSSSTTTSSIEDFLQTSWSAPAGGLVVVDSLSFFSMDESRFDVKKCYNLLKRTFLSYRLNKENTVCSFAFVMDHSCHSLFFYESMKRVCEFHISVSNVNEEVEEVGMESLLLDGLRFIHSNEKINVAVCFTKQSGKSETTVISSLLY